MSGQAVLGREETVALGAGRRSWLVTGFVRRAVSGWVRLVAALGPSVSDK